MGRGRVVGRVAGLGRGSFLERGGGAAAWLKKSWTSQETRERGKKKRRGDKAQRKGSAEGAAGLEQWLPGTDNANKHARVDPEKACVTATAQLVP